MSNIQIPEVSFSKVFLNAKKILKNPLPFHHKNFEKLGDTFRVHLGMGKSAIFTRDAGFAIHMLQKQHRKYHKSEIQTKDLAKYVGEGLLTSNGEKWLKQRRLIQPAFHKKKLELLVNAIKETVVGEISNIKANCTIDIFPLMSDLAFQVVAKSLFSYTDTGNTISRLQYITETAQKTLVKEIRQPYKRWWFHLTGEVKATLALTRESRDILNNIILERKASDGTYGDLLDMLLAARYEDGSGMDNEQLIDEILILFIAGHETTSNALTFTVLLLAMHPDIQNKVYDEVSKSKSDEKNLFQDVNSLMYTKQCIEEAMRLYPPAYFSDRVAIEDDNYNGFELPKGSQVLISLYEIHRHTDFWKNPNKFDPDRFHPDHKKEYSDWYFPFGAGPRMCIGNNFAVYEMILTISEIVKKYKITTDIETIEINPLITLKPLNALVKCIPR